MKAIINLLFNSDSSIEASGEIPESRIDGKLYQLHAKRPKTQPKESGYYIYPHQRSTEIRALVIHDDDTFEDLSLNHNAKSIEEKGSITYLANQAPKKGYIKLLIIEEPVRIAINLIASTCKHAPTALYSPSKIDLIEHKKLLYKCLTQKILAKTYHGLEKSNTATLHEFCQSLSLYEKYIYMRSPTDSIAKLEEEKYKVEKLALELEKIVPEDTLQKEINDEKSTLDVIEQQINKTKNELENLGKKDVALLSKYTDTLEKGSEIEATKIEEQLTKISKSEEKLKAVITTLTKRKEKYLAELEKLESKYDAKRELTASHIEAKKLKFFNKRQIVKKQGWQERDERELEQVTDRLNFYTNLM